MPRQADTKEKQTENAPPSILVVDDDPVIRDVIAQYFIKGGWNVVQADNALDALVVALEENFSVVLTDFNMPRDSGTALLEITSKVPPRCTGFYYDGCQQDRPR